MNIKKTRRSFTSVREQNPSTTILLRLFTLSALSCCFTFVSCQSNDASLSTAEKSTFAVSTIGISLDISASSSQPVQVNYFSENVNRTNSSSLTSLHNKTAILTLLQSSKFPVVGSTEPITLALSFVTTSTSTLDVPRSVRSLLDASSFSIVGFTTPLKLAIFTSESLSNQSIASLSSRRSVLRPSSSVLSSSHVFNASNATMASMSSAKTTFLNSVKILSSSLGNFPTRTSSFVKYNSLTASTHDQTITASESDRSSQRLFSSQVNDKLNETLQVNTGVYSTFQSFTSSQSHSPTLSLTRDSLTVPRTGMSAATSPASLPYQASGGDTTTAVSLSFSGTNSRNTSEDSATAPLPPTSSKPLYTSASPTYFSSLSRFSLTMTLKNISLTISPHKLMLETSSAMTSAPLFSTLPMSSPVILTRYSIRSSRTSISHQLESTTKQATSSSTNVVTNVTNSYVSLLSSAVLAKTKTLISTSSPLYNSNALASNNSVLRTEVPFSSIVEELTVTTTSTSSADMSFNATSDLTTTAIHNSAVLSFSSSGHLKTSSTKFSINVISAKSSSLPMYISSSITGLYSMPSSSVAEAKLSLNASTLSHFSKSTNLTQTAHLLSSDTTMSGVPTAQVPDKTSDYASDNSSGTKRLTSSIITCAFAIVTSYISSSISKLSSYVSTNFTTSTAILIEANVSSDQSVRLLSTDSNTSLSYQTNITQVKTMSASSVIIESGYSPDFTLSLDKSGVILSTFVSEQSYTNIGAVSSITPQSQFALAMNSSRVASYTARGVNYTADLISTSMLQNQSVSYSRSYIHPNATSSAGPLTTSTYLNLSSPISFSVLLPLFSSSGFSDADPTTALSTVSVSTLKYLTTSALLSSNASSDLQPTPIVPTLPMVTSSKDSFMSSLLPSHASSNVHHTVTLSPFTMAASQYSLTSPLVSSVPYNTQPTFTLPRLSLPLASSSFKTSSVLPSLTLSAVPAATSKHLFVSSIVPTNVLKTFSIPSEWPFVANTSLVVKPESSFSISSASEQLQANSPKKTLVLTLVTLGESTSFTVHGKSSYLHAKSKSSLPSRNITAALLSVNISVTPSGQPHSSSYNVRVDTSHSLLKSPGFTATVPTAKVTAASYSGRSEAPSTSVLATTSLNSLQTGRSSNFYVGSSSFMLLLSSTGPTLPPQNTRSSALLRSHTPSGVPVATSIILTLLPSTRPTLPSVNTSVSDSMQIPLSGDVSVVSSRFVVLSSSLAPSSPWSGVISNSVDPIMPGISVRFGISVPQNQSLNDSSFENQLREGILSIYQNDSLDASSGDFSIRIMNIERRPDSNSTNVTVIFQVLNGSEPLAAHPVIQSFERASISLEQAVGYMVVEGPSIVHLSSTSAFTISMTVPINSSILRINTMSRSEETLNSTQQLRAFSTAGSLSTPAADSPLQSQGFSTALLSLNVTTTASSKSHPSSGIPLVRTTYSALSLTQSPTSIMGSVTSVPRESSIPVSFEIVNVTHHSIGMSVMSTQPLTQLSEVSSTISHSHQTKRTVLFVNGSETSSKIFSSSDIPVGSSSSFVSLTFSQRPTVSSTNVSSTASLETYTSNGVSVVTSSNVLPSSPINPSSTSAFVVSSSVFVIPPSLFARFGISVPLNESVTDVSFKQKLEIGIHAAFENGSVDGMTGNVSVSITSVKRSPDSNSTNVTVTFQVLNESEPLLAYPVIQSISKASLKLARAVGYKVILDPIIVYLSPTSSPSTTLMTSAISPSSEIASVTSARNTPLSSEIRQQNTGPSFMSSVPKSVNNVSVRHISPSRTSSETIAFPKTIFTSLSRSFSITIESYFSSRLLSTSSRLFKDTNLTDSSSYFRSLTETGRFLSSSSLNGIAGRTLVSESYFSTNLSSYVTQTVSSKTLSTISPSSAITLTTSISRALAPSQTVKFPSSSSLLSQTTSAMSSQPSLLQNLSTGHKAKQSETLIATYPSLNLSSAFIMVNSTETNSILLTESSVAVNFSALASAQGTSMTPRRSSSPGIVNTLMLRSSNIMSAVASASSSVPSLLSNVTTTVHLMPSNQLSLNSHLSTYSLVVENTSSQLPTVSKPVVTSSIAIYPKYTARSSQTSFLSRSEISSTTALSVVKGTSTTIGSTSTGIIQTPVQSSASDVETHVSSSAHTQDTISSVAVVRSTPLTSTYAGLSSSPRLSAMTQIATSSTSQSSTSLFSSDRGNSTHHFSLSTVTGTSVTPSNRPLNVSTIPSAVSRQTNEGSISIHITSLDVASTNNIPFSYASVVHTSPTRANLSRETALYSVIVTSARTSPNKSRFSDVSRLEVSHSVSLTNNKTTVPKIATSSVKVSSLPVLDISTTLDVSFSPVSSFVQTTPVTRIATRAHSSSEHGTTGLTTSATEVSFSSQSAQQNISSDMTSLFTSLTATKAVSSKASVLSSMQTLSSPYPFRSPSPSLVSKKVPSTLQSLITTWIRTPDISTSSASPKITSVIPLSANNSVTYFPSNTTERSIVSLAGSISNSSVGSIVSATASPSASNTFIASKKTSIDVNRSVYSLPTSTASDLWSLTVSTQILLHSSKGLSQTRYKYTSTQTVDLLQSSLPKTTNSPKSLIVETLSSHSVFTMLTAKSSNIFIHSTSSSLATSDAITTSSAKGSSQLSTSTQMSSERTTRRMSTKSTLADKSISVSTFRSPKSIMPGSESMVLTDSSLFVLPLTSTKAGMVHSSLRDSHPSSSSQVYSRFSSFSSLLSSLKTAASSILATGVKPSGESSRTALVKETSFKLSSTGFSETISSATTMPLFTATQLLSTVADANTALTPESLSKVSKTFSTVATSVEPTQHIRPTMNPNNTEGLVGIQILVPTTENETNPSFRETIELRLAAAYRWGKDKGSRRRKRDLRWIDNKLLKTLPNNFTGKNLNAWKQSAAFKVYNKRASRFRRQVDNIVVLVEIIRRAKPIVGEEIVDIEYRIFDGLTMLSAEHIVETTNRLSEAELVSTLKYGVTLRPYVVRQIQVTPSTTAAPTSQWETLIPAIIVPVVVILFLILAFLWARYAARRTRKQQKVKPDKQHPYQNLEIKVLPSHDVIPPKNKHGLSKKRRSSISSTSSSDIPQKCPTLPLPDYSFGPSEIPAKPSQRHRRRKDGRDGDHKRDKNDSSTKNFIYVNGNVQHERAVKKSIDDHESDHVEMKHLAGVLENRPQMRDEKLATSLRREEPVVRFTSLPPLIQTPLVGPKTSIPDTATEAKKEYDRIVAESGVPQAWLNKMKMIELQNAFADKETEINEDDDILNLKANVERWRNKMRHREKLRQDVREKERERNRKLKHQEKDEKEGKSITTTEDQASTLQRSLTAERKRKSRLERWRKHRVGTSSSKSSSSSSSSSSSESDSDVKKKHKKYEEKKKKQQTKDRKTKDKAPPLTSGHAAKTTAHEALRETAWTIKETPGVRLVSVRPLAEGQQGWQEQAQQPYLQNGGHGQKLSPTRPDYSRSQQRDRVHYLLETGYPVLPVMPTPIVRPAEPDDHPAYEDMEGLNPYMVQYDEEEEVYLKDDFSGNGVPAEPRQAFGGPSFQEEEHIYEEPTVPPGSLPQTHLVSPQEKETRALIPTHYAHRYIGRAPVSRGRPISASQHPGTVRPARARPTSARTDPMPRYASPPGRISSPSQRGVPPSLPGSRYMFSSRPTVATAPQPSIGTSPRYMVDPERQKEEPPSSFDSARVILSRAQANVDRFEQDSRSLVPDATDAASTPERTYTRPQKRKPPHAHAAQKETAPTGGSRLDVAAREHAELEAQLLVSRALARARNNDMLKATQSYRVNNKNVMQYVKNQIGHHPLKKLKDRTKKKKDSSSSSSSSSSTSSEEIEKREKQSKGKMKSTSRENQAVVRPLPAIPRPSWTS